MSGQRRSGSKTSALTIAIPKGRIFKQLLPRLEAWSGGKLSLSDDDRRLVHELPGGVRLLSLKPDDVPTYVEYGAADLGIVGRDTLLEREHDVLLPLDLGIGRCKLAVAALDPSHLDRQPLRVATKYPNVAARHFAARGKHIETIFVQGSVELAPIVGLADVIVDLVETGRTLRDNGLSVVEDIAQVSSVVIANRASFKLERARVESVLAALVAG